jgi:hypothetical protein
MFGSKQPPVVVNVYTQHPATVQPEPPVWVEAILATLKELESKMTQALDNMAREVAESRSVTDSAIAAFAGIRGELQAVREELAAQGVSSERLDALSADLNDQQQRLAAAIAVNTNADPNATDPAPEPALPPVEEIVAPTTPADPAPADAGAADAGDAAAEAPAAEADAPATDDEQPA